MMNYERIQRVGEFEGLRVNELKIYNHNYNQP